MGVVKVTEKKTKKRQVTKFIQDTGIDRYEGVEGELQEMLEGIIWEYVDGKEGRKMTHWELKIEMQEEVKK